MKPPVMTPVNVPEMVEDLLESHQFLRTMKVGVYGHEGKVFIVVEDAEGNPIFQHDTGLTPADSLTEVFNVGQQIANALKEVGTDADIKRSAR